MKKKKTVLAVAAVAVIVWASALSAFRIYTADYYPAKEYRVDVAVEETEDYLVYGETDSEDGLIFYPGAKVEETAYAPLMQELAEAGICCVVVRMPCRMAVLDINAAEQVIEELDGVRHWYLGGHSLGGAMAAAYASKHGEQLDGLILLAAYSSWKIGELPVLSIYGSRDEVLDQRKYARGEELVETFSECVIDGGNHAGFGNYGAQKGDGSAQITKEEQWQETVDYILNFVRENSGDREQGRENGTGDRTVNTVSGDDTRIGVRIFSAG